MATDHEIFLCSYCGQRIKFRADQSGGRGRCPGCGKPVVILSNVEHDISGDLSSCWFYERLRLLKGREEVGPLGDDELVAMIDGGELAPDHRVKSPTMTEDRWVTVAQLNVGRVRENIAQRAAEADRRRRHRRASEQTLEKNRRKLKGGIRRILESGGLSLKHRQSIEDFARKAGIPDDEIETTIASETETLLREVFEEVLEDGLLEPEEEQRLSQLAISLGATLEFDDAAQNRIRICRLAYELNRGTFRPEPPDDLPFQLKSNESYLAGARATWFEVVSLKRPAGIPLGNDHYLKEIASGSVHLTDKQVCMIGELTSKKFTMSSVQRVSIHRDGVLFNRSSGKSVFLGGTIRPADLHAIGLIAENLCSGQPVLGTPPSGTFIPERAGGDARATETVAGNVNPSASKSYTFRVVGDFVGDRQHWISRARPGDLLLLKREPDNPEDRHAVAVFNQADHQLGYVKRDVAAWFGPMLDRGVRVRPTVRTLTDGGSLLIDVAVER